MASTSGKQRQSGKWQSSTSGNRGGQAAASSSLGYGAYGTTSPGGQHSSGRRSPGGTYYGTPSTFDSAENAEILLETKGYRMRGVTNKIKTKTVTMELFCFPQDIKGL